MILNDILTIRKFEKLPTPTGVSLSYSTAPSPLTSPVVATNPVPTAAQPPPSPGADALVAKFCEVTGLKPNWALECLTANGMNPDLALNTLRTLKVQYPSSFFFLLSNSFQL